MFEQDYLMRTIHDFTRMLARILFGKDTSEYEFTEEEAWEDADLWYRNIRELADKGEINQAENLLYERLDGEDRRYLEMALDFYSHINENDLDYLDDHDFSREEIQEGLDRAMKIYGVEVGV